MPTCVKICGLTRPQDVESAMACGADYLGFIVEAKSRRRLDVSEASQLANPATGIIPRVAVTVNAADAILTDIMAQMAPDYIQCHGDETPERVADIGRRFNVKTIKAVAISTREDIKAALLYTAVCDFILFDAKPPKDETIRGGHGVTFDWNLLKAAALPKIWALAGGLNPDNARVALHHTQAPILDVSSGVEAAPGIKDAHKIKAFMEAVKHG